ncbi:hypothetical protein Fot_29571 [Forsythia ovata]|uniref:Uncharacterized protein n=1 Tax=Forsythia ovata TaxID=205694 RepID=A0ABD1TRM4_9LAMI
MAAWLCERTYVWSHHEVYHFSACMAHSRRAFSHTIQVRNLILAKHTSGDEKRNDFYSRLFSKNERMADTLPAVGTAVSDEDLLLCILAALGHECDAVVVNLTSCEKHNFSCKRMR